jgi:hypothetical protein
MLAFSKAPCNSNECELQVLHAKLQSSMYYMQRYTIVGTACNSAQDSAMHPKSEFKQKK